MALELLDLALVPGSSPAVYAIGMATSRITMDDQQKRSVNIVWALLRERRVLRGEPIAIIGAGIAGVTAAAYAHQQGLEVALFERHDAPFSVQQGSKRWVHPNLYEWPADGWQRTSTDLPCMNWSADTAGSVVAHLRGEWDELRGHIDWHPTADIVGLRAEGSAAVLIHADGTEYGPYTAVLMAAGFGEEPQRPNFEGKPYWRDDDLHQRLPRGGHVLVSGCGDGGLIDAIRVALQDFRHEWLGEVATAAAQDPQLVQALLRIERDTPAYPDGAPLTEAVRRLPVPSAVVAAIKRQLRPNTIVTLNSHLDGPLTRATCLLNRFVIAQLMELGVVTHARGQFVASSVRTSGDGFEVTLEGKPLQAQVVVVRHGPQSRPLEKFPALDRGLGTVRAFLRTYRAGVDRTRAPAWTQLPAPAPASARDGELPPSSSDVMAFIAEKLQASLKEELQRQGIDRAIVRCFTTTTTVEMQVHLGSQQAAVRAEFAPARPVVLRAMHRARELSVSLPVDAASDPSAAASALEAIVPDVARWLLEDLQ